MERDVRRAISIHGYDIPLGAGGPLQQPTASICRNGVEIRLVHVKIAASHFNNLWVQFISNGKGP